MEKQKRIKTGGRKPSNKQGVRITFTPTDDALNTYNKMINKSVTLNSLIVKYGKEKDNL